MTQIAHHQFQNKCSVCVNSAKIDAHPTHSSDQVDCPVGGHVTVATGCAAFEPSQSATCSSCWNYSGEDSDASCSVHGILAKLREACPEAVERAAA
ncbi:MAG: hypothetical protein N4A61_06150 [Pelagimonas sp.]|jgi:hypothetical protein|nr:hypothetical protein [Pelagimonas sp.]